MVVDSSQLVGEVESPPETPQVCSGLWWFVGVCGGLWGFVVVCGGLWGCVVVCGSLWWLLRVSDGL